MEGEQTGKASSRRRITQLTRGKHIQEASFEVRNKTWGRGQKSERILYAVMDDKYQGFGNPW